MNVDCKKYPTFDIHKDTHLFIEPHPKLSDCIAHYTYMQDQCFEQNASLTLVPDAAGCLVLQDSGNGLECMFWGPTTRSVKVHANPNLHFRFFVEFHPTGAYALFHHDLNAYINILADLKEVDDVVETKMIEAYRTSSYLHTFVQRVDAIFLELLHKNEEEDKKLKAFVLQPSKIEGMGYSKRHVQRLYQKQLGCSRKDYQRVERINQAVKQLQETSDSVAVVAQACGYYDESHFIHDFSSVLGVSPKQYKETMSVFYNEERKF